MRSRRVSVRCMIWKIGGTIIRPFWRRRPLSLSMAIIANFLYLQPAGSTSVQSDATGPASAMKKSNIVSAIDHVSSLQRNNFKVFSTLLRTYKVIPQLDVEWPSSTGPVSYWSGRIVNLLAFQNIVMIVYDGRTAFEDISRSSGDPDGYLKRYNALFHKMSKKGETCYFERYISRKRWIAKGVIVVDISKGNIDNKVLLRNCASAGTDFINGLPFPSNQATLEQLPAPPTRAVLIEALYSCSFEGSTDIKNPERSRDGLTERPSKRCVINRLNDALSKTGE